jgi:hypothetical protein
MMQGPSNTDWYSLRPDATGNYVDGTWTELASIPAEWAYSPSAFASAVLADGRVVIVGGEFNAGKFALTNLGAIYDPVRNAWERLEAPPGWANIGDSPSVVLPGGQFLVGRKLDDQVAMLDPVTLKWTLMGSRNKRDFNAEEGWTLMPDGTVLTVDVKGAPNSERYLPSKGEWIDDGSTIVDLHVPSSVGSGGIPYPGGVYHPPGEVGPLILRPDGTVLATGASSTGKGHTSIYKPGATSTSPGTWTPGPDFPGDDAGDASAVLLPNGNALVVGTSGKLYEFNGSTLTAGPAGQAGALLIMLPNGQALVAGSAVSVYSTTGHPLPEWAPVISSVPSRLTRGTTFKITGTQLNGLSQAAAFGDEFETATNYPLVRIKNVASGHAVFARTHGHSSMGVATGRLPVTTSFDVPAHAEPGPSQLVVVANGIKSQPAQVVIQ